MRSAAVLAALAVCLVPAETSTLSQKLLHQPGRQGYAVVRNRGVISAIGQPAHMSAGDKAVSSLTKVILLGENVFFFSILSTFL